MNANELLDIIGTAKDTYIQEAAACRMIRTHAGKPRRLWLIAAIIALMVFLMGCALVLFTLQDKVIDTPVPPEDPTAESKSVVALYGYEGSPLFTASKQWYGFTQSYDPEGALYPSDGDVLSFPGHYMEVYGCYTREMADKVEAVAAEHGLKLLSGLAIVQRQDVDIFLDAVGLTGLHNPGIDASINYGGGYFHPEGNFNLTVDVTLTAEDAAWPYGTMGTFHYARKDCFDPDYALADLEEYDQWIYRTAGGTELLIAMGAENALLFAETEDAWITVTVTSSPYSDTNPVPDREALQQLAEVYDFTVCPGVPDWESATAALKAAEDQRIAEANAALLVTEYAGFSDFLKARYTRVRQDVYFGFADVTGDGEQELLLGDGSGSFESVYRLTEEGVQEALCSGCFYLCENGRLESTYRDGYVKGHSWLPLSEAFFFDPHSYSTPPEAAVYHDGRTDSWTDGVPWAQDEERRRLTEAEAAAILAAYPRQEIPMMCIMDFPLADGTTLEDYIRANAFTVSEDERMALYAAHLASIAPELRTERSHYCLYDLNGDGIEDLLIGTEHNFRDALTVHNDRIMAIEQWCTMNLCEGGILKITSESDVPGNGFRNYRFLRFEGGGKVVVEILDYDPQLNRYNRCTDGDGYYDQELTGEEFEKILAGYKVVSLPMTPVGEFPCA